MKSRSNPRRIFKTTTRGRKALLAYESLEPRKMLAGDLSSPVAMANSGRNSLVYTLPEPIPVENRMDLLRDHLNLSENEKLELIDFDRDTYGFAHLKYQQLFNGFKVEGGVYSVHVKERQIYTLSGDYKDVGSLDASAVIAESVAFQHALDSVGANAYIWDAPDFPGADHHDHHPGSNAEVPGGDLVVLPTTDGDFALTYKFDVFAVDPLSRAYIFVDASNGDIVENYNRIHEADAAASGTSLYNGEVDFTAFFGGVYFLFNEEPGVFTFNLNGSTDLIDGEFYISSSNQFNEPEHFTGVQTHFGVEQTLFHLSETYGYDSYDNRGTAVLGYNSFGMNYSDAFWTGDSVVFGDGDGTNRGPFNSLDIVAHELYHGVTEFSAGLVYAFEPGALNESFSDIFGKVVENYATGSNNWLLGDDIGLNGSGAFRNMENPNQFEDPDTYLGDFWYVGGDDDGGVHTNSGVQNKWFQLLTDGGTGTNDNGEDYDVVGIGIDDAAAIAFRNLTVYLTPDSEYPDARTGSLQAVKDLFSRASQQYRSAVAAWDAVGVYDPTPRFELPEPKAIIPAGSLIYRTEVTNVIDGDVHGYFINLDANQSLSIKVTTDGDLEATVQMYNEFGNELVNGLVGSEFLFSQDIQNSIDDVYDLVISGNGTVGQYTLELWLNTNLEEEGLLPDILNDSIEQAQDIEASSTRFDIGSDRLAVLGGVGRPEDSRRVVYEGFETGVLDDAWTTSSSHPGGRIRLSDEFGTASGSFALYMDQTVEGEYNLNEAIWTVDVTTFDDPFLRFFHADFNDETNPLPDVFKGSFDGDGVSISEDGETWYTILTATDTVNRRWVNARFSLAELAAQTGLSLDGEFQVKFQQYDNFSMDTDGRGYDQISIEVPAFGEDWYSFRVNDHQLATVVATGLDVGDIHVDVYDAKGNKVLNGSDGSNNVNSFASQFVGAGATYYARVTGETSYSLVVTRGGDFDIGPNDSVGEAQDITDVTGVLGYVASLDGQGAEPDDAVEGEVLNVFFPGVTLSNVTTGGDVFAADGSGYGAPTGTLVFSPFPDTANGWREGVNVLRADFDELQSTVSIDVGSDDNTDSGYLRAYAADGTFLEQVVSSALMVGESETLTITRPFPDIAYILAAGNGGDTTPFDNLVFRLLELDEDFYSFEVAAGEDIDLTGLLPGDGPGWIENGLSNLDGGGLRMELFDPEGTLIATGSEAINVVAELDGVYQVRVFADAARSGEYFLLRDVVAIIPEIAGVDFGPEGSEVFPGYAGVSDQEYDPGVGYGWTDLNGFRAYEGSRGNVLTRDRAIFRDGTFVVNVENGDYDVDIFFGNVGPRTDEVTITIEGEVHIFRPMQGPNVVRSFATTVSDGQLTLEFSGAPGLERVIRLAGFAFTGASSRPQGGSGASSSFGLADGTILGSRLQLMPPSQPITTVPGHSLFQLPTVKANGLTGAYELTRIDPERSGVDFAINSGNEPVPSVDALNEILNEELAVS